MQPEARTEIQLGLVVCAPWLFRPPDTGWNLQEDLIAHNFQTVSSEISGDPFPPPEWLREHRQPSVLSRETERLCKVLRPPTCLVIEAAGFTQTEPDS